MRSSVFYPRIQKTMNQSLPFVVTEFGCANAFPMIFLLLFRYLYPSWKHDINDMHLLQVCLHVRFLAKPSLLLSTWISHYTYQRFDPHQISSTLEEGEWVKYAVCYDICIRITQHIHTKRMITRMYINSPFSLISSTPGPMSCMGFVSMFKSFIGSSVMMFSASISLDLGHLAPFLTKTLNHHSS